VNSELRILGVASAIGLDVLALSIAIGIKAPPWSQRIRLGLAFATAEIFMQVVGLGLGTGLGRIVGAIAGWIGLAVLACIGAWVLREGFCADDDHALNVSSAGGLLLASLSISLDSLGIGFALPALQLPLVPLFATVAGSTACFTLAGLAFGAILGHTFRKNAEKAAGIVLIVLALVFAVQALRGS